MLAHCGGGELLRIHSYILAFGFFLCPLVTMVNNIYTKTHLFNLHMVSDQQLCVFVRVYGGYYNAPLTMQLSYDLIKSF